MSNHQRHQVPRVELAPGKRLGNYVVERKIGSGSQGDVFLAQDAVLGRNVALKVLSSSPASPYARSLLREARLIAMLDNPAIVRVYHIAQVDNLYYIAIEYVDGGALDNLVRRQGPLRVKQAIGYALAMSEGLRHAHDLGIVHSDINPKNLLIARSGQLKIADFGLAFIWESPSSMGGKEMRGTPLYMAPEVWRGESASPLSDIYSAGACLYFMLAGRPPFPESELARLRQAHLERAVLVPSDVPRPLANIIHQCMGKTAADRPASALALGRLLRDAAAQYQRRRSGHHTVPTVAVQAAEIGDADDDIIAEFAADEFSEVRASALPELMWGEAEAALMMQPPYGDSVRALAAALDQGAPLVLFQGGDADDRLRLARSMFTHGQHELLPSLARIELELTPGTLLRTLANQLGVDGAAAPSPGRLLATLRAQDGPDPAATCCVQLHLRGAMDETDAIELAELAVEATPRGIQLLVSCSEHEVSLLLQASQAYELDARVVSHVPVTLTQLVHGLITWTRAATEDRFVWSRDALLLACDAVASDPGGTTLRYVEVLAANAVYIAAHAQMRLITSWCVSGAAQHPQRIERTADIQARWRRRPSAWPPQALLSKLAELRTRWPDVGKESRTEAAGEGKGSGAPAS
ncbi:serine/threonine-protein kinase [Haliangium sp.]|uniref:serine/threonine-protein kinase n=1 Tax=Haliangium sp. TaxID=2663208 RepID=UPI003D0FB337